MPRLPIALTLAAILAPGLAFAQGTPAPPSSGTLKIERIETVFVVAPDYKVTGLDGDLAHLAGGYAGWVRDRQLLVGGAVYSVANGSDDFRLTYGGLVAGWTMFPERRIQFGARGLVGVGQATLGTDISFARFGSRPRRGRSSTRPSAPEMIRIPLEDEFFVVEPQLNVVTRLNNHVSINFGAGYRLTALVEGLDDRVNGGTASLAVQLGGW
jgi:hypothetical protein